MYQLRWHPALLNGRHASEPFGGLWDWPGFVPRADEEYPLAEVFERDHYVIVRVELPGVDPKDVDVRVTQHLVTVQGEIREATEQRPRQGYYRSERRYGGFFRRIELPAPVIPERAKATYQHGILEIAIGKQDETEREGQRLQIEVH